MINPWIYGYPWLSNKASPDRVMGWTVVGFLNPTPGISASWASVDSYWLVYNKVISMVVDTTNINELGISIFLGGKTKTQRSHMFGGPTTRRCSHDAAGTWILVAWKFLHRISLRSFSSWKMNASFDRGHWAGSKVIFHQPEIRPFADDYPLLPWFQWGRSKVVIIHPDWGINPNTLGISWG